MPWTRLQSGTLRKLNNENAKKLLGEPFPKFFLTGDGHRKPPFTWVNSCSLLKEHLQHQMMANQLCMYVEELQENVKESSVPPEFVFLVHLKRVFGWEPLFTRRAESVFEDSLKFAQEEPPATKAIEFGGQLGTVLGTWGASGGSLDVQRQLTLEAGWYQNYSIERLRNPSKQPGHPAGAPSNWDPMQFLLKVHNTLMGMRTVINPAIARQIYSEVAKYPDSTHLITVGDAHILENNIADYLDIGDAHGVIDTDN